MAAGFEARYHAWFELDWFLKNHLPHGEYLDLRGRINSPLWDFLEPPPPPKMAFDAKPVRSIDLVCQAIRDSVDADRLTIDQAEMLDRIADEWGVSLPSLRRGRTTLNDAAAVARGIELIHRGKARSASEAATMICSEFGLSEQESTFVKRVRVKIGAALQTKASHN
jgi:hypothetical protein